MQTQRNTSASARAHTNMYTDENTSTRLHTNTDEKHKHKSSLRGRRYKGKGNRRNQAALERVRGRGGGGSPPRAPPSLFTIRANPSSLSPPSACHAGWHKSPYKHCETQAQAQEFIHADAEEHKRKHRNPYKQWETQAQAQEFMQTMRNASATQESIQTLRNASSGTRINANTWRTQLSPSTKNQKNWCICLRSRFSVFLWTLALVFMLASPVKTRHYRERKLTHQRLRYMLYYSQISSIMYNFVEAK